MKNRSNVVANGSGEHGVALMAPIAGTSSNATTHSDATSSSSSSTSLRVKSGALGVSYGTSTLAAASAMRLVGLADESRHTRDSWLRPMFTKGFQFAEPVKLAHDGRSVGTGGSGLTLWSLWCVEPLAPESQAAAAVAEKSNDDDEDGKPNAPPSAK